jgi:integrase/recombinase XerD
VVRLFAIYVHYNNPAHEIPPARLIVGDYRRITPFLYTDNDINALITAAGQLSGRIRPVAYQTLIGLLAATGMRISEALALNLEHVDLDEGLVTILNSKFGKSRRLPIHPSTIDALTSYLDARHRTTINPDDPAAFLVSDTGRRIAYGQCQATFARCTHTAGITPHSPRCRPRLHDLRHTFAVNTLVTWYSTGVDVNVSLPYLSTYLGHINPASTYWYLTASPELAGVIAGRLDTIELVAAR